MHGNIRVDFGSVPMVARCTALNIRAKMSGLPIVGARGKTNYGFVEIQGDKQALEVLRDEVNAVLKELDNG